MFQIMNNYKPEGWPYSILIFISGIATWMFGDLTSGMIVLIVLTAIDFCTGLLKAGRNGKIVSNKFMKTVYKFIAYVLLIFALHVFFFHYIPHIPSFEPDKTLFSNVMVVWFNLVPHLILAILNLREMSSIIENLAEAGYLPRTAALMLSKVFTRVSVYIEDKSTGLDKPEIINNNQSEPEL